MKKLIGFSILILAITGLALAQVARGQNAWVSARTVTLKSSTGFFASNRGTVSYGDQVSVLQVSGKWAEVRTARTPAITGWMPAANLSSRRIIASGTAGGASASELALAGKGFDRDVENAYRTGGNLNYADVDRTEAITVTPDQLLRFITEGRLARGDN